MIYKYYYYYFLPPWFSAVISPKSNLAVYNLVKFVYVQ